MTELSFGSIVHVTEKGGSFGGTEEYISLVTSELAGRGVRSHLVCGALGGTMPAGMASVEVLDGLAAREPATPAGPALAGLLERLDADVVYLHNLFDAGVVAAAAAVAGRGPLLWYVHDHYPTCLSELRWRRDHGACRQRLGEGCLVAIAEGRCVLRRPERTYDPAELGRRRALGRSLRDADGVIVVSDYMRSLLVEAEPALVGRTHLLPRPVRGAGSGPPRRRRPGDADTAVVTFVGRITPEKGLDVLVEAVGAVRSRRRVELWVAGVVEHEGHWARCRTLIATAIAANPRLRVRYLGHLDYGATDRLLRRSDLVAVPSQWPEPFGAVALEAMSAGATVLASRVGGLATCITDGETGVLLPPGDTAAWTDAIEGLLDSPGRAALLAGRGQERARAHTAAAHVAALDDVVRGTSRRRTGGPVGGPPAAPTGGTSRRVQPRPAPSRRRAAT